MKSAVFQAIRTTYHGPTNYRGARITAVCDAGKVTIPYPYELNSEQGHRKAAEALMAKLGWNEPLTQGGLGKGYVFTLNA